MALLRSEILNKDFIDKVIRQSEATNKVSVSSLRIGKSEQRGSLLEERLIIYVEAVVKGRNKGYGWLAKVLRPEAGPANYARFQGILETEVSFYTELLPELTLLGAPLPKTFPVLWGDCKTLNREILLLEDPLTHGFESAVGLHEKGLNLGHVILVVEWLAKFHALSYVLMRRHQESSKGGVWIDKHPWIRKNIEEGVSYIQIPEDLDENDLAGRGLRKRLMTMVATCLKSEASGDHKRIENLIERQDWLDNLRKQAMLEQGKRETDFVTLCHGEPWIGSIYFRFDVSQATSEADDAEKPEPCPVEVALADFHACSVGRPGFDLAHFLLTSTTREFRKNHLETVLQIYLTELEDIVISQGFSSGFYSASDLRSDYRRGLVSAITFCLFAMPMLMSQESDEVDAGRGVDDVPEGDQLSIDLHVRDRIMDGLADVADMVDGKI